MRGLPQLSASSVANLLVAFDGIGELEEKRRAFDGRQ